MAYIGRDTDKISNVEVLDNITFDGSSSYTLQKNSVNFTPSSANTLLVSIDGVVQAGNFTVSGSTIDFGVAIAGTSTCDFILHYGVGLITAPSDGTVTTAKLADSSVTTAKINDGAVTTAKLNDASVSLAKLTATGTKDATTFLRGDNTFAEAGGGVTNYLNFKPTTGTSGQIPADIEIVNTFSGTPLASNGTFTVPTAGNYFLSFHVLNDYNGINGINIKKNGSNLSASSGYTTVYDSDMSIVTIENFSVNDTITFHTSQRVYHNYGGMCIIMQLN